MLETYMQSLVLLRNLLEVLRLLLLPRNVNFRHMQVLRKFTLHICLLLPLITYFLANHDRSQHTI